MTTLPPPRMDCSHSCDECDLADPCTCADFAAMVAADLPPMVIAQGWDHGREWSLCETEETVTVVAGNTACRIAVPTRVFWHMVYRLMDDHERE